MKRNKHRIWTAWLPAVVLTFGSSIVAENEIPDDLERHFSQGRSTAVVKAAGAHLRAQSRNPELYMARGRAYYDMMQFDRALADFRQARSLGLSHSRRFGNPEDFAEKAQKADQLLPIVAAYPSRSNYRVALRSSRNSAWARAVAPTLSRLDSLARELFGKQPDPGITLLFLESQEHASEFGDATSIRFAISADRPDASAYGSDGYAYFFEVWTDGPSKKSSAQMQATGAHEFVHAMQKQFRDSYPIRGTGRLVGYDWYVEGLATYGQQIFSGESEENVRAEWTAAYKRARDIDKEMVLGDFQRNLEFTQLNYVTGSFMVRDLIRRKGKGIIPEIERALMDEDHRFYDVLPKVTGINMSDLYDQVVAGLKKSSGTDFAEQQFEPPSRSTFVVGDLVLARNTYSRDEEQYLPASYSGTGTGRIGVYYLYGSSSFVSAGQLRHFDWRKGSRVMCRVDGEARPGTVTLAARQKVYVDMGSGARPFALGDCHERGADTAHNKGLRSGGGGSTPVSEEVRRPRPPESGGGGGGGGGDRPRPARLGEGSRVSCTGYGKTQSGVVSRTIGDKVLVNYDRGGAGVFRATDCRPL